MSITIKNAIAFLVFSPLAMSIPMLNSFYELFYLKLAYFYYYLNHIQINNNINIVLLKPLQKFYIFTQRITVSIICYRIIFNGCDTIARLVHALFYFWIFGIISVFLDLDHIIQVYQSGLEFNLENLAFHGARTLHIPILILSGSFYFITAALLLRFWNLNSRNLVVISDQINYNVNPAKNSYWKTKLILNITSANSILSPSYLKKPKTIIVKCPRCEEYIGVIPTNGKTEFPCPYCGIEGYVV